MEHQSDERYLARGRLASRIRSTAFHLPAWFAPHKTLRVWFHRLRGVNVGRNVEIGYYCLLGNVHPYNITIGNDAVVAANSVLLDHDNALYYAIGGPVRFGPISIGRRAFIGVGAIIMPGVTIGEHAIVAPQSFVRDDVPAWTLVAGSPARAIKTYVSSDATA